MPVSQESLKMAFELQQNWIECAKKQGIESGEYGITDQGLITKNELPIDPAKGGQQ